MNEYTADKGLVVGLGEVLWDVLPGEKKVGGAPANFAYHVSQFGLPGCIVSAVGADALGRELTEELSRKSIAMCVPEVPYPTGRVLVDTTVPHDPQYDILKDVAWDNIPFDRDVEARALHTRAVCFGSLAQRSEVSRRTIRRFINSMPSTSDTLKVYDINLRQHFYTPEIVRESLGICNVLKINDAELITVAGMLAYGAVEAGAICRRLLTDYSLNMVILTCGDAGSYVYCSDGVVSYRSVPEVKVADTVGAGDSFTAAFIASLLRGAGVQEAHTRATATAAYVCTCRGAMPKLPCDLIS